MVPALPPLHTQHLLLPAVAAVAAGGGGGGVAHGGPCSGCQHLSSGARHKCTTIEICMNVWAGFRVASLMRLRTDCVDSMRIMCALHQRERVA